MKTLVRSYGDLRESLSLAGAASRELGRNVELQWFRASTRKVDRHRSVIEPSGLSLEDYGGVFGWGHDVYGRYDGSAPPPENVLGSVDATDQTDDYLDIGVRWAGHERAVRVREMIDDGFINSVSVGFIPKEVGTLELDSGEVVEHYLTGELLEVSVAIVPSNAEAQALAVQRVASAGLPGMFVRDWKTAATVSPASAAAIDSDAARTFRALTRLRLARGRGVLGN